MIRMSGHYFYFIYTILLPNIRKEAMKIYDELANANSNKSEAVNLRMFGNPEGAEIFCIWVLRILEYIANISCKFFKAHLSKNLHAQNG